MTHPYLEDFLRQCQTDRELKEAIRDLKRALADRQVLRMYNRILCAAAALEEPERAAILAVYRASNRADIMDPIVRQRLRKARLATPGGSLTNMGMRVGCYLKAQERDGRSVNHPKEKR